jgi:hypothetical protein
MLYNKRRLLLTNIKNMENMNKKDCGGNCACGGIQGTGCYGYHGGKHYLIKVILMLIIVMMIFCSGFKLGEIVGSVRGSSYGGWGMMGRSNFGMMRGYDYDGKSVINVETAIPSKTPVK